MFCRDFVAQLRDHADQIAAAGADLAAVGTGDLEATRAFQRTHDIPFPLLVDEAHRSYEVIGARQLRAAQVVSPRAIAGAVRAMSRGRFQGKAGTAPTLLGATHVLRPDGSVSFAWVNADLTDKPAAAGGD